MLRAITVITFAAAMFLGNASYADAQPAPAGKQIAVNYADLNISRPAGAEVLITRMRAAAAQVCGPAPDVRDLVMYRFYRHCIVETVERGVAALNAPVVTEVYRGNTTLVAAAVE